VRESLAFNQESFNTVVEIGTKKINIDTSSSSEEINISLQRNMILSKHIKLKNGQKLNKIKGPKLTYESKRRRDLRD